MPKTLPSKAAKKSAKKAAQKMAAKAPHKAAKKVAKAPGEEARKAYEHLGRLRCVRTLLDAETAAAVELIFRYAQAAVAAEQPKGAADLLRAAEHLAFSRLSAQSDADVLAKPLQEALRAEMKHRLDRAAEHWDAQENKPTRELRSLYKFLRQSAKALWKQGRFAGSLESARAVDALAHAELGQLRPEADGEESEALFRL